MLFGKYLLMGHLLEGEPNQGGGDGANGGDGQQQQQQQQQPDLKALFADFQRAMIGELDKRVNGINKEFKTQSKGIVDQFTAFRTEIDQRLKPKTDDDDPDGNGNGDGHQQHQQQQNNQNSGGNGNQGGNNGQQPQNQGNQNRQQQQQTVKKTPEMLALEREIATLKERDKQREEEATRRAKEAERKEADALVRTAISNHKFNASQGPADLFDLVRTRITRGDDGELYGPEGMKLEEYIASEYNKRPFLHPAKNVGGSGASASQGGGAPGRVVDLNEITPDMTPEQLQQVTSAIAALIPR